MKIKKIFTWIIGLLVLLISNFVSAVEEELIPVKPIPMSYKILNFISYYGIYFFILIILIIVLLVMLNIIKKTKYKAIWIGGIIGFIFGLISYYAILMFYARCWQRCEVEWVGNILDFLTPVGSLIIFVLIFAIIGGLIGFVIKRKK